MLLRLRRRGNRRGKGNHPLSDKLNKAEAQIPRYLTVAVSPEQAGERVSTLLRQELKISGTVLRRAKFLPDGITLDGQRTNTRMRPQAGQLLSVRVSAPPDGHVEAVEGVLNILYEDADLVVLDKPPGVTVHPGPGHWRDTLGNFLTWHFQSSPIEAAFHPVHRLDKGTSGLMVVAKHPYAQEGLKQQLHTETFLRRYLAVCDGLPHPPAGRVDAPIGRCEDSALRREVRPDGDAAVTRYWTQQTSGSRTLVELELETGRTHQIRVHMAWLGCPLTGDFLYGREDTRLIGRPALHSSFISFCHPVTGAQLAFQSPLPADIAALL